MNSMQILQDDGYKRPGLDALCEELNIKRNRHLATIPAVTVSIPSNNNMQQQQSY